METGYMGAFDIFVKHCIKWKLKSTSPPIIKRDNYECNLSWLFIRVIHVPKFEQVWTSCWSLRWHAHQPVIQITRQSLTRKSLLNALFRYSQKIDYPFVWKMCFQSSKKQENIVVLSTTPKYCTLMADSVQWLSQSDCSICISILVEFY